MWKKVILLVCGIFLVTTINPAYAQILVHYTFDEGPGGTVEDVSGKGNDGVVEGILNPASEPEWVDGKYGLALSLNGDEDVNLPAEQMGLRSDSGTWAAWINMGIPNGINTIFWGGDNTTGGGFGPENEVHFHVESTVANIWIGGELAIYFRGDPNNVHLFSDPNKGDAPGNEPNDPILMGDEQWHHIAATWGNQDGNAKLYIDANLIHELPYTYTNISFPFSTMFLGRMAGGGRTYTGLLDDVQIYGGALTQEELQLVMAGNEILNFKAALPLPGHQGRDVPRDVVLQWLAGDKAGSRHVYFGTSFDDVDAASLDDPRDVLVSQGQTETSYDPPGLLDYNTTYYWRVDEVNATPDAAVHKGSVWSFTVENFITVDNFEQYDDIDPNRVFDAWMDGFNVDDNGSQVGYLDPPFMETAIVNPGNSKQSMPYSYDRNMKYVEATLPLQGDLTNWNRDQLSELSLWFRGHRPFVGGFEPQSDTEFMVTGGGTDIYGGVDEFHFAYRQVSGSTYLSAKVESLDNTDPFAKAGVMIRDTLEPGSPYVAVLMTPENGVRFQWRETIDQVVGAALRVFDANVAIPYWVRVERTAGGLIRGYYSADGSQWTQFPGFRSVAGMSNPLHVGLAVTSHNVETPATAVFSNVSFGTTNPSTDWEAQDVGILSNSADTLYVALNDSAVYYENPDPNDPNMPTQMVDWTEWRIPLQTFADQGVDLNNVTEMDIGVGLQGDTATQGGTGLLYFDDIRLYRPEE